MVFLSLSIFAFMQQSFKDVWNTKITVTFNNFELQEMFENFEF